MAMMDVWHLAEIVPGGYRGAVNLSAISLAHDPAMTTAGFATIKLNDHHVALSGLLEPRAIAAVRRAVESMTGAGARVCVVDPLRVLWGLLASADESLAEVAIGAQPGTSICAPQRRSWMNFRDDA
jgi:hypothetical protein